MSGIDPNATMPAGPPTGPPSGFPPPGLDGDDGDGDGPEGPRRPGRALLIVAAVVVVLALAGGVGWVVAGDEGDGAATTTTADAATDDDPGDGPPPTPPEGEAGGDSVGDDYTPDSGATGYDVEHYDLEIAWDPDTLELDGVATITATATQDLSAFSVDLYELEVGEVTVDGEPAEVDVDGRDVRITPTAVVAEDDEFEVEIAYGGEPDPVISAGFPTGWLTTDDGGAYVIGEPDGAATWFPGNDHPSDKATFSFALTVPDDLTAGANGAFEGREPGDDGLTTWHWSEDDPMATYLAVVAIGDYRLVEEETEAGLPLFSLYPEDDADRWTRTFDDVGAMIEVFEEHFGPYPYDEYGAIVVPESLGLALETQTRSIFGEDVAGIELFRAHELAHQWYGDAVSPEMWSDIWLNEGFASYGEMLWFDASDDGYDIDRDAEQRRSLLVGRDEGPILDPGVDRWFSEAVYQRGALTLHALRRTVGDDVFFEILQRWVADNDNGNGTTEDFVALAEDLAGEDLDDFFEAWLVEDQIPELP